MTAFKTHGTERVLIADDRDAAGEVTAEKLSKQLIGEGLDAYRLQFPNGSRQNNFPF